MAGWHLGIGFRKEILSIIPDGGSVGQFAHRDPLRGIQLDLEPFHLKPVASGEPAGLVNMPTRMPCPRLKDGRVYRSHAGHCLRCKMLTLTPYKDSR